MLNIPLYKSRNSKTRSDFNTLTKFRVVIQQENFNTIKR